MPSFQEKFKLVMIYSIYVYLYFFRYIPEQILSPSPSEIFSSNFLFLFFWFWLENHTDFIGVDYEYFFYVFSVLI